ncbi:hypothetical protein FQN60_018694 [Etheostoma spectabile]|uniref:guanylate cyclase n=1 Tax=Etheostoma spectabile TaxID=54343 RepID=A0A5J5CE50_9PERO|nr:hypothetical protein FQN60_018694 [Etheostoma spectabile]
MLWMESLGCMLYLCSPKLRSLQELQDVGLHLADWPSTMSPETWFFSTSNVLQRWSSPISWRGKKEELRILSQHLEAEKRRQRLCCMPCCHAT